MPIVNRRCILITGPPWGFRVYVDSSDVLTISKIRRNSPADIAKLRSGDHIISLNGKQASGLTHADAITLIDTTVGTLDVEISRFESTSTQMITFDKMDSSLHEDVKTEMNMNLSRHEKSPKEWEVQERTPTPEVELPEESLPLEKLVRPSSPDVKPVPISKLLKEYKFEEDPNRHIPPKPQFTDSSFYHDPYNLYPTTEERMEMARRVASSLYAPDNRSSKGASIFEKQRKRADKYTLEKEETNFNGFVSEEPKYDLAHWPEVAEHKERSPSPMYRLGYSSGPPVPPPPPPPPVPNAAKSIQEFMEKVQRFPKATHNVVSPDVCFDIAAALHSSDSRGAQIFAKQKHRAQKWTVTAPETAGSQPMLATSLGPVNPSKQTTTVNQESKQPTVNNNSNANQLFRKDPTNLNQNAASSSKKPNLIIRRNGGNEEINESPRMGTVASLNISTPAESSQTNTASAKWKPVKFNVPQRA